MMREKAGVVMPTQPFAGVHNRRHHSLAQKCERDVIFQTPVTTLTEQHYKAGITLKAAVARSHPYTHTSQNIGLLQWQTAPQATGHAGMYLAWQTNRIPHFPLPSNPSPTTTHTFTSH